MKKLIKLLFIIVIATYSCKDESSEDAFSLQIVIKDSLGIPIPNIDVYCWNLIKFEYLNINKNIFNKTRASSWITYDVKTRSAISLIIYDLENKTIKRLIDKQIQDPGHYTIVWNGMDSSGQQAPSTVYKFEFTARDTQSNGALFSDHMYGYMLFHNYLGKTSINGNIETNDKSLFPNLYNLATLPAVDDQAVTVGDLIIKDSIELSLSYQTQTVKLRKKLVSGINSIEYIWSNSVHNVQTAMKSESTTNNIKPIYKTSSLDWKLYQIYPNPFN